MKNVINKIRSSKIAMLAICLIAGSFGIHRFLMRRWVSGIVVCILCMLGFTSICMIVDAILIATGKLTVKPPKQKKNNEQNNNVFDAPYTV